MSRTAGILCAALMLLLFSCSKPASVEQYVRNRERDTYGWYAFSIDMSDSLFDHDIFVYVRMRVTDGRFAGFSCIPVTVLLESPDSMMYEGQSWITRKMLSDSTYFWKTMRYAMASDLVPAVCGKWNMYLTMPEDSIVKYGVEGLGISVKDHGEIFTVD